MYPSRTRPKNARVSCSNRFSSCPRFDDFAVFWFRRWTRSAGAYAALAGIVAVAAVSYDRTHLADILGASKTVAAHVGAGWGLDLAFVGAVSLTIAGVAWVMTMTDLPWAWVESAPDDGRALTTAVDLAVLEDEQTS